MIRPFGEAAFLVEVADAHAGRILAQSMAARPIAGVLGTVPGRRSVLVELDPVAADPPAIAAALEERLSAAPAAGAGRLRRIPVAFGGRHGPDLEAVADAVGMSTAEFVDRLTALELEVLFLGFAPGFAYLGGLPDDLRVARLPTPRTRTPAGSVALADDMAGIYPMNLPGGWPVVGATPLVLWDPERLPPTYLAPGDRVRLERSNPPVEGRRVADDW